MDEEKQARRFVNECVCVGFCQREVMSLRKGKGCCLIISCNVMPNTTQYTMGWKRLKFMLYVE